MALFLVGAFITGILAERVSDRLEESGHWLVPLAKDDDIRRAVFERSFRKEYEQVRKGKAMAKLPELPSTDPSSAYHEARPAVLEVQTFADELNSIQTSIRFTRSLTILSALLGLVVVIRSAAIGLVRRPKTNVRRSEIGILVATLATVCGLSALSYSYLEEEYDKRVYAYHLHLLKKPALPK
jgi:hypothetical protein